jgi:hypothetical protein
MRLSPVLAAVVALFCLTLQSAKAQVTLGSACTTTNWITVQPNQIVYCNASNVWAIAHQITSAGLQGIDTVSPLSTLSVNGGVAIGTTYAGSNAAGSNNLIVQGSVGIGTTSPGPSLDISKKTDALALPAGSTAQRPSTAINGEIRYNSDTSPTLEAYVNNAWTSLATNSSLSTITLGTSASVTNPQRPGDPTTGLFSSATSTVAISVGGSQKLTVNTTGVGIGTGTLANVLDVNGSAAFGTYAGIAAPSSGLIVSGNVGIMTVEQQVLLC